MVILTWLQAPRTATGSRDGLGGLSGTQKMERKRIFVDRPFFLRFLVNLVGKLVANWTRYSVVSGG